MSKRPVKLQRTYQARIPDPEGTLDAVLGAYADLYGQAERALFADIARGCDPAAHDRSAQAERADPGRAQALSVAGLPLIRRERLLLEFAPRSLPADSLAGAVPSPAGVSEEGGSFKVTDSSTKRPS